MQYQLLLASVLALTRVTAASRPACLLAALTEQPNPADTETVCDDEQEAILERLVQVCDDDSLETAYAAFAETCMETQNIEVGSLPSSAKLESDDETDGSGSGSGSGSNDGDGSTPGNGDAEDVANGIAPSLVFLVTGLAATGLTSIVFL